MWKVDSNVNREEVVHLTLALVLGGEVLGGDLYFCWDQHGPIGLVLVVHLLGLWFILFEIKSPLRLEFQSKLEEDPDELRSLWSEKLAVDFES